MDFQKPFSVADVAKYPKEVLIVFLIGLNLYSFTRKDDCSVEVQRLNARIDTINTERLRLYDKVIFQGLMVRQLQEKDSVLKVNTRKYVTKILRQK